MEQETKTIKELTLTRVFNAPRELVFRAWTDEKELAKWWGPIGFTAPVCELDLRPGGKIVIQMLHRDFPNHWMGGHFQEIVPPERIVFVSTASNGRDGAPLMEVLNTITFAEEHGKTTLTVHAAVKRVAPEMAMSLLGMDQGWNESLDKLLAMINGQ